MKVKRNGATRIVYLTKHHAFKLPRLRYGWTNFLCGWYCNLSERQCWNACNKFGSDQFLCPIRATLLFGLIQVMPRLEICTTEKEVEDGGIPFEEGEDWKSDNYGYYQGRVVCVDYPYHRIKPYLR